MKIADGRLCSKTVSEIHGRLQRPLRVEQAMTMFEDCVFVFLPGLLRSPPYLAERRFHHQQKSLSAIRRGD
jgi:hypothetical protein